MPGAFVIPSVAGMTRLEFTHTTKKYRRVTAVDDLTFAPAPGRVTGFVGNNGAGKSTSMRMLLGLTRPTSGSATVDGKPYAELRDPLRAVGAMVDPNVFHPGRSGRNALRVLARAGRIPDSRVDEVLGQVDLAGAAGRRVGGYSMGMRQRLGLAAALLGDPAALLLDEPANGLDPHGVHWLRQLIRGLAGEGRTVLVSSHLLAELAQTADDVAVIDRGRLVTHQPMSELLASAAGSSLEDVFFSLTSPGSDRS
jgi:ABC-2 type transport system ATP-binding protein